MYPLNQRSILTLLRHKFTKNLRYFDAGMRKCSSSIPKGPQAQPQPPRQAPPEMAKIDARRLLKSRGQMALRLAVFGGIGFGYPIYFYAKKWSQPAVDLNKLTKMADFPSNLQKIIDEEYQRYLAKIKKTVQQKPVEFYAHDHLDPASSSSWRLHWKSRITLPFFLLFNSPADARAYCQDKYELLNEFDQPICVLWDREVGQKLLRTFAKRYAIARELYGLDHQSPTLALLWLINLGILSVLIFILQWKSKIINHYPLALVLVSLFFYSVVGNYMHWKWEKENCANADETEKTIGIISADHLLGGLEYYHKKLERNRIFRNMLPNGKDLFTAAGSLKRDAVGLTYRYDQLKKCTDEDTALETIW